MQPPRIERDTTEPTSIIGLLRRLAPSRPLSMAEARRVAELQATQLLLSARVREPPIPSEVVSCQTKVVVSHDFDMPDGASGACEWNDVLKRWAIIINGNHPATRQRFTLLHEYKHILDHAAPPITDAADDRPGPASTEQLADYFAACALMPRTLVLRAWNAGHQGVADLARRFDVSERAMEIRLAYLRLVPHVDSHFDQKEAV